MVTSAAAPGDGEVNVVLGEGFGLRCAQVGAFNLHAARRVAPNDKQGKEK